MKKGGIPREGLLFRRISLRVCGASKEMGRRKIKEIERSFKGGIYEVIFGYHSKMEGYTTLMSDMRFSSLTQIPSALRISTVPLGEMAIRKGEI